MQQVRIVAFVLGICVATTAGAVQLDCGGTLPAGETAVLNGDVDCGLIYMGRDATLDLNGHTFTGLVLGPENGGPSRFTIRGPGEIVGQGFPGNPCVMFYRGRVLIDGGTGQVTLRHCGYGVLANTGGSQVTLHHVTVKRSIQIPMLLAVQVTKVDATDVTIDFRDTLDVERGNGIQARKITGSGIVLRHVARGLTAQVIVASDVTADDTQATIAGPRRADLTRLTSTRHDVGIYGHRVRLTESSLTDANPGGLDVGTSAPPLVVATTCERSARWDRFGPGLSFGGTWGICALD